MTHREERLLVIQNIKNALDEGDSFAKVELGDPTVTDDDRRKIILPFDLLRKNPINKIKAHFARRLAEKLTQSVNAHTEIVGLENALGVTGGAFITANHYNPTDSTPVRMVARACGKRKKHAIVIQETNALMTGAFGFLMKNAWTLPVSASPSYMARRLAPAIDELIRREFLILVYPEQEMWFNYKKPRALRDGVYHWAAKLGVPVIPTFCEMVNLGGELDECGFLPVKHVLHVMPPIYPDPSLSIRENREMMREADARLKREKYEEVYKIPLDNDFIPERDIAGYVP